MLAYVRMASPVGPLKLVAAERGLRAILWGDPDSIRVPLGPMAEDHGHPVLAETRRQLEAYFNERLTAFDLPLDPVGTPFQHRVWSALRRIPYGETRSYGALARELGDAKTVRAVGAANGRNPLSIVVPCHRVIGADGALVGFAGGLDVKAKLLALEGHRVDTASGRIVAADVKVQLALFT